MTDGEFVLSIYNGRAWPSARSSRSDGFFFFFFFFLGSPYSDDGWRPGLRASFPADAGRSHHAGWIGKLGLVKGVVRASSAGHRAELPGRSRPAGWVAEFQSGGARTSSRRRAQKLARGEVPAPRSGDFLRVPRNISPHEGARPGGGSPRRGCSNEAGVWPAPLPGAGVRGAHWRGLSCVFCLPTPNRKRNLPNGRWGTASAAGLSSRRALTAGTAVHVREGRSKLSRRIVAMSGRPGPARPPRSHIMAMESAPPSFRCAEGFAGPRP